MQFHCGPVWDPYQFSIRIDNRPVGIMLSGGIDSATLLLLLSTLVPSKDIIIFTVPRQDDAYRHARHLVNSINNYYNTEFKQPCMVGNGYGYHGTQVLSGIAEVLAMYQDIQLFLAENQPPEPSELVKGLAYPIRAGGPNHMQNVSMPFWSAKKYHIISMAIENSWQKLFDFTHSCCVWPAGRCKVCFNCVERKWAFSKLNLTDTGER
jgi:7-cyano-7-deazaguanine synthase in queuosine biosynthesis